MLLVEAAARMLAFQKVNEQLATGDPRRLRLAQDWLRELAQGPLAAGVEVYAYAPDPRDQRAEVYRGEPGQYLAYHIIAKVVNGKPALGVVYTPTEGRSLRVPDYGFSYELVPQVQARRAILEALPQILTHEPQIERAGTVFFGRLADDDPNWRDSLHEIVDGFLSTLHGAVWPTFSDKRIHSAQRWAWMAEWFSHFDFDFEVDRYKSATWYTERGPVHRKMTHAQAVETAIDRLTRPESGWSVAKWPDELPGHASLTRAEIQRCLAIKARAEQLAPEIEASLGPASLELRHLRKPPWATLQQHLCHHFVEELEWTWAETAHTLGISTPQEVGRAVKKYREAKRKHQ